MDNKTLWDYLNDFINIFSFRSIFFLCFIFCIIYLLSNHNLYITLFITIICLIIHSLYINKLNSNTSSIKEYIYPKSKYIEENDKFLHFIFSIQEFYNINPILFIDMVKSIDKFLEIYNFILIDNSLASTYYNLLVKQKIIALHNLQYIIIELNDNKEIIIKYKKSLNILENLLNEYIKKVIEINNNFLKKNGYNINTYLINSKLNYPYNESFTEQIQIDTNHYSKYKNN